MCSVISIFGPWCIREFRWLKTFSYSEKATIICAIFLMVWTLKKQTFKPWGKLCKFLWLSQKSWTLLSWIMFATLFMTRFHEFLIFEAFFNFISKTFFDWFLNYKIINFCAQKKCYSKYQIESVCTYFVSFIFKIMNRKDCPWFSKMFFTSKYSPK